MGFINTVKPLWQAIKSSPATAPAVLMAWGIPTVCVPLFRFLDDQKRPFHDRLMLSIRDLAAYAVGWIIFLVVTPSLQYGLSKGAGQWSKPWSYTRIGLVSSAVGCLLASAYSGFGAKRLAEWATKKWPLLTPRPQSGLLTNLATHLATNPAQWQPMVTDLTPAKYNQPNIFKNPSRSRTAFTAPVAYKPLFSQRY